MRVVVEEQIGMEAKDKNLKALRDPEEQKRKFMQTLLFKAIKYIKEYMSSGIFKHPTGALMNSINGYIIGDDIIIYSDKTYARAQEFGVEPHVMWYLIGKTVPIKIFNYWSEEPETLFRRVTYASIARGGWRHPGFPGKYYMRTGIDKAMQEAVDLRNKVVRGEDIFI